ncbi:hypothetical protein ANANG_G00074460, partial [Anguilla anguilla]
QEGACTDSTSELTISTLPSETPAATIALLSDDPGLVNPAFDPSAEDNSQSGSNTSLAARSTTKKRDFRNFDRATARGRSFRRINRALSALRRTKSGTSVPNQSTEERDNARNATVPRRVRSARG